MRPLANKNRAKDLTMLAISAVVERA